MTAPDQSDDALVRRALKKAGKGSNDAVAEVLGVSKEMVRRWRADIGADVPIHVHAHMRDRLRAYVAGRTVGAADEWRGVVVQMEREMRQLADKAAAILAGMTLD